MSEQSTGLGQPIPPGQRQEWAALLAGSVESGSSGATQRLFLFRVHDEWFGVDPVVLAMTIPYARPRQLPHQRGKVVEGLINADGRVILCLSMERFAGVAPKKRPEPAQRLLVFSPPKWLFAMPVSEVLGVEDVAVEAGGALPESASEALRKCARAIVRHEGRAVIVLDGERFIQQLAEALR